MFATQRAWFRGVCLLMAVVVPLAPSVSLYAQTTSQVSEATRYMVPNATIVALLRPRQILTSDTVQMLPVEVAVAASLKELGIDPTQVESIRASVAVSFVGLPDFAAVVKFTEKIDVRQWSPKLTQHTMQAQRDGKAYLQSQVPSMPSIYWLDDSSLLLANEQTLEKLLSSEKSFKSAFDEELARGTTDDLLVLLDLVQLRPVIQAGLMQARNEIPPEIIGVFELPNLIKQVRIKLNISGAGPIDLSLEANDEKSADRVSEILDEVVAYYQKEATAQAAKLLASEDPIEQAMGKYIIRVTPTYSESFVPTRSDNRFTLFNLPAGESSLSGPTVIAVSGVLVALLLPAVQAAREAARHNTSINNMKQILMSIMTHEDWNKRFPTYANFDADGKPLLSWRVHILPHLEQQALYGRFHLDEPWDSEHNKQLIPLMPEIFLDPSSGLATTEGRTHYLAAKGDGFMFDSSGKEIGFASIRDGSSNTVAILQVNNSNTVIWTQPEDWEWNDAMPLTGLVPNLHPGVFLVGFVDGHVSRVSSAVDQQVFKALLTRAGGEVIDPASLNGR